MRNVRNLILCGFLFGVVTAANSIAVEYEIVDLGTLGGNRSYAYGINDSGQVVGRSYTASGDQHAFLWTPGGGMQDLGTLGEYYSEAKCINNAGQIAGKSVMTSIGSRACLWTLEGGMQTLGILGGNWGFSEAYGHGGIVRVP